MDLTTFCKTLPKLELHAHLNGSLSAKTLKVLQQMKNKSVDMVDTWNEFESIIEHGDQRTLDECFQLFSVAHSLTSSPAAISKATEDVIQEFEDDGVIYLELRSTPRHIEGIMTKQEYIEEMVKSIMNCNATRKILSKLIVSIDRSKGKQDAEENVEVAINMHCKHPDIVVGVDLSGNPNVGDIMDFLPLLEKARTCGLGLAVHCAEVPNQDEVRKLLELKPERIGHGTCIHPEFGGTNELWNKLKECGALVEVCLTSNVKTKTVKSYKENHLDFLLQENIPLSLATDDKGVFATSLSEEYQTAAENFFLTRHWMCNNNIDSLKHTFTTEAERNKLTQTIEQFKKDLIL